MTEPLKTAEPLTVLVTGATGTTGSRVAARLAALGHTVRAASRRGGAGRDAVRFDWYDPDTHAEALRGADRAYLVPPVAEPDPAAVMGPFLEQARAEGVTRVALLSSSAIEAGGPGVGRVHQLLADEGPFAEWSVLRPSWFMQNFTGDHLHAESIRGDGVLTTATGTGRVGFVDADDIAAVAARALTDPLPPGPDLVVTGPEALSYADVAAVVSRVTGRAVRHRAVPPDALAARLTEHGMPAAFARILAALDDGISRGIEDRVTDTVERVTGASPRSFARMYRDAYASSRSTATAPSR
ncbi:NmrA family NAD(P)-binding protein [Streptomyces sp. AN091965]|uniref:NmrA family NAD(P)-binding protein n=1 Tax=Streptomyces sp. AN091965 TaxID=2927803 RepID=UPI001F60B38C|nr:NAD-dependent epimerase/dehydratase family protein [Streptomyces sp. AN091965]MCI3930592.1 NAD(P)H-binding protein [Streptomyces sp. AN091965]